MNMSAEELAKIVKRDGYSIDKTVSTLVPTSPERPKKKKEQKSRWKSEWYFQDACVKECDFLAIEFPFADLIYANANAKGEGGIEAGVKAGIPDLLLPVARHGYHGLYIELKRLGDTLRDSQEAMLPRLEAQGYLCKVVVESLQDFIDLLHWYLGASNEEGCKMDTPIHRDWYTVRPTDD